MNKPLGGTLIDRIADAKKKRALSKLELPELAIPRDRIIEAWNIATGAYSPIEGFMTRKELASVLQKLKLTNGVFWPIPIVLDIDGKEKKRIAGAKKVFLTDGGKKVAVLSVRDIYPFQRKVFQKKVFATSDLSHPGVAKIGRAKPYLLGGTVEWIGGRLNVLSPSMTPKETRAFFAKKKWKRIVAFHTRNVPHRGHEHIQLEGLKKADGLLVQPLVGSKKKGDFRNEVVAKAYRYFAAHLLPRGAALLSFLPYSAYYAGPREALLTAVIRKNFGCTHFIVGRDHTAVGDFYKREEYTRMIKKYTKEMGIEILHFASAFYCTRCKSTAFDETCPHEEKYRVHPSGTLMRKMLTSGKIPPTEMMRPEISRILLKEKELFV